MTGEVHHQGGLSGEVNVPTTGSTEAQKLRIGYAVFGDQTVGKVPRTNDHQ